MFEQQKDSIDFNKASLIIDRINEELKYARIARQGLNETGKNSISSLNGASVEQNRIKSPLNQN